MTHKDKRAGIVFKGIIEGLDGFHVHVVGRLVQQHDIGLLQNKFAEQHAPLLAAGDDIDRLIYLIFGKQQPAKGGAQNLRILPLRFPVVQPVDK